MSSIISTTGFSSVDFDLWPEFSRFLIVILMFIGACAGSTGGALKCSRVLVLFKCIRREINQVIHPRSVNVVKLDGKVLPEDTLRSILLFFAAYMLVVLAAGLVVALDNFSFGTTFTAVVSCIGNVGPGLETGGAHGQLLRLLRPVQAGAHPVHDHRPSGAAPHPGPLQQERLEPLLSPPPPAESPAGSVSSGGNTMKTTKELIRNTARELFNERGYRAVSMRNIADALGISVGNLTYHYPQKELLMEAIMDAELGTLPAAPDPGCPASTACWSGCWSPFLRPPSTSTTRRCTAPSRAFRRAMPPV